MRDKYVEQSNCRTDRYQMIHVVALRIWATQLPSFQQWWRHWITTQKNASCQAQPGKVYAVQIHRRSSIKQISRNGTGSKSYSVQAFKNGGGAQQQPQECILPSSTSEGVCC